MRKNKELISIIIPVYNVEKYLVACVESCLNQDYKNVEILLIDDGSTDNSGVICDKFAKEYSNILTFHKDNEGLSDARNYGIEKSNGEWVLFVDSDDIVSESMVSALYAGVYSCHLQCNLSVCGLKHFYDKDIPQFELSENIKTVSGEKALIKFLYQKGISTSACGKLYRKKLLNNNFFVRGQRFEDNDFLFRILASCDLVAIVDAELYAYRHRERSITTSKFSEKDFDIIEIGMKVIDNARKMKKEIQQAAVVYQCTNALRVYLSATSDFFSDSRYEYCKKYLDQNINKVIFDRYARKKLKVGLLLYKFSISKNLMNKFRKLKRRWG